MFDVLPGTLARQVVMADGFPSGLQSCPNPYGLNTHKYLVPVFFHSN
jgi:hypothetical protein